MLQINRAEIDHSLLALTQASLDEQRGSTWQERRKAERKYLQIDKWLDKYEVPHFYSHKAERYLYKRYWLIVDGYLETETSIWDQFTLLDSETRQPAFHANGQPVMLREPIKSRDIRKAVYEREEAWNLVESGYCGACGRAIKGDGETSEVYCRICFHCAENLVMSDEGMIQ